MSISWIALAMAQGVSPPLPSPTPPANQPAESVRGVALKPGEKIELTTVTMYHPNADFIVVRGRRESRFALPASIVQVQPEVILNVDDIATAVPGVWMVNDQDPGTNILSIRGATTDRLQQASVAFVLDGVPLADTELFTPRLFDVSRIEVLKGPQGALFGKNAAGGVISVRTQDAGEPAVTGGYVTDAKGNRLRSLPDLWPKTGYIDLRGGNGGLAEVSGAISFGLGGGFVGRLAGVRSHADGWIRNTTLSRLVDETNTNALRASVQGTLAGWEIDARAHYLEEEGGAAWASSNNVTGKNGGRLSGDVLINPIGDYAGSSWRRWGQGSVRATHELFGGTLKLLAARDSYAKRWDEELDYRPGPLTFFGFPAFPNGIQPIRQPIDITATTLEARFVSKDSDTFSWQAGLFAQATNKDRVDDFGPLLFGSAPPAYLTKSTQTSAFGGLNYNFTYELGIEIQGRIDHDERTQTIVSTGTRAVIESRKASFSRFQPRIAVHWEPDGSLVNLYASYGEAFRPGGFNPAPAPTSIWKAAYRPEITTSFELGAKFGRLPLEGRIEVALFSNAVTDFQNYTFIDNQSVTLNVDEVLVKGVEVSGSFQPFFGSKLGVSYALADAEIQRFIATDPLLGSPATRDYTGKAVPNAPGDTGKVWGSWSPNLKDYRLIVRVDANYAGKTFYEIDNVLYSPARWWADLNVSAVRDDWALSLKGENITDERWAISAFGQGMTGLLAGLGPGGPFDTFTINRGRRVSVSLKREF